MIKKSMGIRSKLLLTFLSIIVFTVVCTTYFSIRATADPLRAITNRNVKSMVDEFYTFLEANPDIDQALIRKMCNEQITIGKTGFIFVINPKGDLLIHKKAGGKNWAAKPHIKKILERKNGYLRYLSPKTKTYKISVFRFFEHRKWIIVASAFEEEFLATPRLEIIKYSSIAGVIITIIAAVIIFLFTVRITNPISKVADSLKDIAQGEGDLTKRIEVKSRDETGELAKHCNIFMEKLQGIIKDIAGNAELLSTSSTELSEISQQMSSSADETSGRANTVATAAEEMSSNMNSVAAAVEEASTNVGFVATSTEEMTSVINEIAQNTEKARGITGEAVSEAQSASEKVDELGKAAQDIGKVTETITEISEQTNLLALNATIEAARAGEAGKGFAVVANEIKELAKQTAEATSEIRSKIEGIQNSTEGTVYQIEQITKITNQVNEIVATIATAVEEQSVTTKEIANNVVQASQGISEVTENVAQSSTVSGEIAKDIAEVNQASSEMSNSSSQVNMSAEELTKLAENLKEKVGQFRI
ncbi:MAG: methyl-accepting chemotaxis protein [Thermodesulfobacteriota bacterium]|nr:methyl-accepting chemotaxis protein [Thermodesulfobacteriota bacterium]